MAIRPRSLACAIGAAALASIVVAVRGPESLVQALRTTAPMVTFLAVGIGLASVAVHAGAAERTASQLAAWARGSTWRLYWLVCALAGLLTAAVTLDGAVVLIVPVVVELHRRFGTPLRPLLLGTVATTNAFSFAVPFGNPTNIVVMRQLGMPLGGTATHMLVPATAATLLCIGVVAWRERRQLAATIDVASGSHRPAPPGASAGPAGLGRAAVQIVSLLVVLLPLSAHVRVPAVAGLGGLLAIALSTSLLAAVANNLPASAIAVAGLAPGPAGYAALIGLSVGALATPHGSVATMIAGDLAGERPHIPALLPAALTATVVATVVFWLT